MRHSISRRFGAWDTALNYNKQESKNGRLAAIFALILQRMRLLNIIKVLGATINLTTPNFCIIISKNATGYEKR